MKTKAPLKSIFMWRQLYPDLDLSDPEDLFTVEELDMLEAGAEARGLSLEDYMALCIHVAESIV